jgi:aerobic-type carbon monoxide dehydrogenase small subunit (CoxS/CutS family)
VIPFELNGVRVEVPDDGSSLLNCLRDRLGRREVKDGCSPQGQCGCCTVWVDGSPRVACVTPARRVAGRSVTTLEGLDAEVACAWTEAFIAAGASQCGFCTPGILMRLAALAPRPAAYLSEAAPPSAPSETAVKSALLAHLCRCTGWRTIVEAATGAAPRVTPPDGDRGGAARRATIEGRSPQAVGPAVTGGGAGFADDLAPAGSLVAVPDGRGGWSVGETLGEARRRTGRRQGRRGTAGLTYPLALPPGDWEVTLRTTWVEPAYLELDSSWCVPGGEPASPLANGGAFGGKSSSPVAEAARRLADEHGRPVRVLFSREDCVLMGPKRPPVAIGVGGDGAGVMRVVRTPGVADAVATVAPGLTVEEVDVAGPPTSATIRGAGWVEAAAVLAAGAARRQASGGGAATVTLPWGSRAEAAVDGDRVVVRVDCGDPLDEVVLRSYCVGAAHMALSWVRSEGLAVDPSGVPSDLTLRSFGVLRAADTPRIDVGVVPADGPPVNGSDAVFAAVAAAAWIEDGLPPTWPTRRTRR